MASERHMNVTLQSPAMPRVTKRLIRRAFEVSLGLLPNDPRRTQLISLRRFTSEFAPTRTTSGHPEAHIVNLAQRLESHPHFIGQLVPCIQSLRSSVMLPHGIGRELPGTFVSRKSETRHAPDTAQSVRCFPLLRQRSTQSMQERFNSIAHVVLMHAAASFLGKSLLQRLPAIVDGVTIDRFRRGAGENLREIQKLRLYRQTFTPAGFSANVDFNGHLKRDCDRVQRGTVGYFPTVLMIGQLCQVSRPL